MAFYCHSVFIDGKMLVLREDISGSFHNVALFIQNMRYHLFVRYNIWMVCLQVGRFQISGRHFKSVLPKATISAL